MSNKQRQYYGLFTRRKPRKGGHTNKKLFPKKKGVNYDALQLTEVGKYSITWRDDAEQIIRKMKKIVGSLSTKHITDLNGGGGGDTITFGLYFKKVDSIELDKTTFDILKQNVELYDLPNVTLHQGDSTKIYNWNTDILYMDPPWGGPNYKLETNLDLFLGPWRIDNYIKHLTEQTWKPKHIFIKVPFNYNFDRFSEFKNVHKFKIGKIYLLYIEV